METGQTNNNPTNVAEPEKSFFSIIIHSFFVIPFLIAVFCVLLFTAVTLLTREQQSVYDLLNDIKIGGSTKRWQAAFELSKILVNPQLVPTEDRFVNELISAFNESTHDDNRVRQYLALAMGRTRKPEFVAPLLSALKAGKEDDLPAIIFALGTLGDQRAASALQGALSHQNPRIRSVAVSALGTIAAPSSKEFLKKTLNDSEPNVQWGSALSLAQMGDASGKQTIINLLNRKYLQSYPEVDPQEANHIILTTIQAAESIRDQEITAAVAVLAQSDPSMKVRTAAMDFAGKINK